MKRDIERQLTQWKNKSKRLPLLIRGARQVGKSYVVSQWAAVSFSHVLCVNFERDREAALCFDQMNPQYILNKLSILFDQQIVPGKTLLFLDEIQDCPNALMSLRYFKEECEALHVIAAGSLLEFVLEKPEFRMPVGRVQYLYLRPLSFTEFLQATGHHLFCDFLKTVSLKETQSITSFHAKGVSLLRLYMALGGMPAVIREYLDTQAGMLDAVRMQDVILQTYRDDFQKYSRLSQQSYLRDVFERIPLLVGQHIKYVHINPEVRSTVLKDALFRLSRAGVVAPIYATSASGIPLTATQKIHIFKALFLDVGLVVRSSQLNRDMVLCDDVMTLNQGAIAEQFVGQELLAYRDPFSDESLFYWMRLNGRAQAEVDYVISHGSHLFPVEVKSGKSGRLRSLLQFLDDKKTPFGLKISQAPLSFDGRVLSVPLYMMSQLDRLIEAVLND